MADCGMMLSSFLFAPVKNGDCFVGARTKCSLVRSIELDRLWCSGLNGDTKFSSDVDLNGRHVSLDWYGGGMSCGRS